MKSKRKNPAKYNRKMEVWGKVDGEDEMGKKCKVDSCIKTIFCAIVPQTGRTGNSQKEVAETVVSKSTHKIKCRYGSGKNIKEEMFLKYNNQRYEIDFILNPFEANVELEIFCTRIVG